MQSRRNILATSGMALAGSTGITQISTANQSGKNQKFVGYTYNPATKKVLAECSANMKEDGKNLDGVYKIDNTNGMFQTSSNQLTIPVKSKGGLRRNAPSDHADGRQHKKTSYKYAKKIRNKKGKIIKEIPMCIETHTKDAEKPSNNAITGVVKYGDEITGAGFVMKPKHDSGVRSNIRALLNKREASGEVVNYGGEQ